jgi:glycosyltransferase involved in cell wall biosynthesis
LLYAGRLVWEKDLATLADAWRLLSARRRDVAMVLAGDGPVRAELERMMPGTLFLGHLNGPELSTAFASSDLFVFPSTTETFGNVSIEAMASGVPPITAREGGAYGVVEHGVTGVHVNPRDPEDLARTIESLLSDNSRRDFMAAAALKHARTQSWPAIFDRLIASYAELVGAARVAGRPRRQRRAA